MMYNNYHGMINMFEYINIDIYYFPINLVKLDIIWLLGESKFIENTNDIYIWLQIDML
jgi:hypothetical protein